MAKKSPAQILGIEDTATPDEAKAAYRRLAQVYHPDKGGNAERFHEIQWALKNYKQNSVCALCEGSGRIEKRSGLAVWSAPCPKCWRL